MNRNKRSLISTIGLIMICVMFVANSAVGQTNCVAIGSPTTVTGSLAAGDLTMTQRPFRDGTNSTCILNEVIGGNAIAGTFRYDATTFTAPASSGDVCVTVTYNNAGCGTNQTFVTAYSNTFSSTAVHTNLIGSIGSSIVGVDNQRVSFKVPGGSQFVVVISEVQTAGCPAYSYTVSYSNSCQQPGYDRGNDGSADLSVWRSAALANFLTAPVGGATVTTQYGTTGMIPTPADWDGDGDTDVGAYQPGAQASFYTRLTPAENYYGRKFWGTTGDIPVEGDYDADNITDVAVYRPSTGTWWALRSSDNTILNIYWGNNTAIPVPGDYDGDQRIDAALFQPQDPTNGNRDSWWILLSNRAYLAFTTTAWGLPGDLRVPADYDGDGKTDIAVYRPTEGNWYILRSGQLAATQIQVSQFGALGDQPEPADYDGDGTVDLAVYRPSNNTWWLNRSTAGLAVQQFGTAGDVLTTSAYGVPR